MDERERLLTIADGFDQLPTPVVLTEGDEQVLVALNQAGRAVLGDRVIGEPIERWRPSFLGRQLGERCRQAWEHGRPGVVRADGLRLEVAPIRDEEGTVCAVSTIGHRATPQPDDLVQEVQDSLLPAGLPLAPGLEIAARYLIAEDDADAGGDWFDALTLPGDRVALVVGDVVGHGVEAAVTMGALRTLLREHLLDDGDLTVALGALDRHAARTVEARAATLCVCVLDLSTGELDYCTAGHPPPLVVDQEGRASFLPASGAGPLHAPAGFAVARTRLAPGDLLVLYSDGLLERPGTTRAQCTVDLLRVVGDTARGLDPTTADPEPGSERTVDRVCRLTLEVLTRTTGYTDDITMLAGQRVPVLKPLHLTVPARTGAVRRVRLELARWLRAVGAGPLDDLALQHAVTELVANAVRHAYDPPTEDREVRVRVRLDEGGVVEAEVADDGRWRDDAGDATAGRGLAVARALVDELHVTSDRRGTTARVRHHPITPVPMLRGTGAVTTPPTPAAARFDVDGAQVDVTGDLDPEGASRLARVVDEASWGHLRRLHVDLAGVGLVSSAAVQVLLEAYADGAIALRAPLGSAAQQVLDLVRLPYST